MAKSYPRGWVLLWNKRLQIKVCEAYKAILEDEDPNNEISPEVTIEPGCYFHTEGNNTKMEITFFNYNTGEDFPTSLELEVNAKWVMETFKPDSLYLLQETVYTV